VTYSVKEIFATLQGEGFHSGRAAVFCRFAGCNLWTGRESQRAAAVCQFCDTDFVGVDGPGGGRFSSPEALANAITTTWSGADDHRFVVFTGGEPLLQLDAELTAAVRAEGFTIAVETNGTQAVPEGVDWVCVSPKAGADLVLQSGDELKLVFPQLDAPPERFESLDFEHFYLQPMDGPARAENTNMAVKYCMSNPKWSLSLQTHKQIGIP
jgi:7-carboxy-7-deazaguanine synthase